MDNNINFKGAFWLTKPTAGVKRKILPTLGSQKKIFNNFTPDGDVLYVTQKYNDKLVAEFLTRHKVEFKYYPKLNTKSGFKYGEYDGAREILNNYKSKIFTTVDELNKIFRLNKTVKSFSTKKRDNTLKKSFEALKLNFDDYKIKHMDGFNEVYTKDGELVALISEPGEYGFRYARVDSISPEDGKKITKRYAIRGDKIQFTFVNDADENIENGTTEFIKRYYEAVNANRNVTHTSTHQ